MNVTCDRQQQHIRNVEAAAQVLRTAMNGRRPRLAIVLGSGLGGLGARMTDVTALPYDGLAGFPALTVAGHSGTVMIGALNGHDVVVLKGRKHFYESPDPYPLKTMIRSLKLAGIETLLLTNAAGSLRADMGMGALMLITDHINFMGLNPLAGANEDVFGPRFFSMTDAWDAAHRRTILQAAQDRNIALHQGVYMGFLGPNFETPAEIRMAQVLGADAVGMSTVPDCLIARHCGLRVAGISCITNMGAGLSDEVLSHEHTVNSAAVAAEKFERLVTALAGVL